ncbi:unnamed protein product [Prorocentrum cordatum]|uniref:Post-GPI attachment to proteins factor 3 n=1 Tax=Prorocentrum cordatum TaxID=2364126 RepID=A0ABN9VNR8_9DINO|nr:unnamed protein product [Polarella glacialis]
MIEMLRSEATQRAQSGSFLLPDRSRISSLRLLGTALPVLYVWSLPVLAWCEFAHTCDGYPRCDATGMSVSNFIANARATGAMAACFFYPALHLWQNAQYVRNHKYVYSTLVAFQVSFGIFLMCPITEVPELHPPAVCLFCSAALTHCFVLLKHCADSRLWLCKSLVCAALASFAMVFILVTVASVDGELLKAHVPALFYTMECCGLSSMAIFPLFWYRAVTETHASQETGANETSSFALIDHSDTSRLRFMGAALPVLYVWSLPLLAEAGFAHKCANYPRCDRTGMSVSNFIANAWATGAMAACFFYPALYVWLNAEYVRHHRFVFPTLVVFQASFGIFITCPVTELPNWHAPAVLLFCIAALVHYGLLMRYCTSNRLRLCQALVSIAIAAFMVVFTLMIIGHLDGNMLIDNVPVLFWMMECCGLSSMALLPVVWFRERQLRG